MYRPLLNLAFLVSMLVAAMVTQLVTNAVARGSGGTMAGVVQMTAAGDDLLTDLVKSVCAQNRGSTAPAETQDCLCQMCLPVVYQLAHDGAQAGAPARRSAEAALPWPESLTLPPSGRLLGDGPSRAPPSVV